MADAASSPIEIGVIDVLKNVSRRPIEPSLSSDLVADLGFDSLQVLEVVAELEDTFDISIPLNDVPATRTVGQVVAQVAALVERARQHVMPRIEDAGRMRSTRDPPAAPATPSSRMAAHGRARTPSFARRLTASPRACDAPASSAATSSRSSSPTPSSS